MTYSTLFSIGWFSHVFSYQGDNEALKGFLSAIETVVGTSYCIGSILAIFLNLVVPQEWGSVSLAEEEERKRKERDQVRTGFVESDIDLSTMPTPTTSAAGPSGH